MVKHIVLFKLKKSISEEEKLNVMNAFKSAIEALPAKISVIRKIEVGLNSEFDSLEDVNFYAKHPDHVAASGLLKDVKDSRACVDYEF